ncbi:hypothetical protein ACJ65_10385 [Kocuria rhizophila]|nr:hypothetical protein ACJ65_10385 [Kocuria rhizophila]
MFMSNHPDLPPPDADRSRNGVSPGVVIALVAVGVVIGLGVLAVLIYLLVTSLGGLRDEGLRDEGPEPLTTSEQTAEPTRGTAPTSPGPAASSPGRDTTSAEPTTSAAAPDAAGTRALPAPSGKPLVQKSGTFEELTLEQRTGNAVTLPAGDEPLLVVWSATGGGGGGSVFVTGAERPGGSRRRPWARCARQTGTALVNASSTKRHTAVLYPEGNSGMAWDVKIYPLSAVPRVERGTTVTGEGPGVFRLPQGPARTHSLEVTAEHDVPSVAVYDADDLGLSTAFEYGTSPVTVNVEVGGGEQVVVVESQEKWSFRPAG